MTLYFVLPESSHENTEKRMSTFSASNGVSISSGADVRLERRCNLSSTGIDVVRTVAWKLS